MLEETDEEVLFVPGVTKTLESGTTKIGTMHAKLPTPKLFLVLSIKEES